MLKGCKDILFYLALRVIIFQAYKIVALQRLFQYMRKMYVLIYKESLQNVSSTVKFDEYFFFLI